MRGAPSGATLSARDLVVQDRFVEGHRDRFGRLEAHGHVALLAVLDRRQLDHAHDDLLVGDSEPDPLGKSRVCHEALDGRGQRLGVDHLAVPHEPGGQLGARGLLDAAGRGDDARQEPAVDVQARGAAIGAVGKGEGHGGLGSPHLSARARGA